MRFLLAWPTAILPIDLLQLLYLPIKAFATIFLKFSNDMSLQRFVSTI